MVVVGNIVKVAFYCRMNHRDKDYTQFLDSVHKTLDGQFGEDRWKMELCRKKDVRVFCTEDPDMAEGIYRRIRLFSEAYMERGDGA